MSEEQPTFEQVRNVCAIYARTKTFADLTVRHGVSVEVATEVSQEVYYDLRSLTLDQVQEKQK